MADWRRDEPRVPRDCATCGRETSSQPSNPDPRCVDCFRERAGLDDALWFVPIGPWHPTMGVVPNPSPPRVVVATGPPPPEVLSTDPRPADAPQVPRAVLGLQRAAEGAGWAAGVAYSRSPERAVRVGTYKITEAFAVWAGVHPVTGWRFNAVHTRTPGAATGWQWRSTAIWRAGVPRFRHATITDLHEFVACMGEVGKAWFKAVHARVEEQAARAKAKPASQKPKEGSS